MLGLLIVVKISHSKYRRTNWFNVRGERWLGGQEDLAREEGAARREHKEPSTELNSPLEGVEAGEVTLHLHLHPQPASCLVSLCLTGCGLVVATMASEAGRWL